MDAGREPLVELINPAARTDPKLLGAASEVRAALAATAHDQTGWATSDVIASRIDLPTAVGSAAAGDGRGRRHGPFDS